MRTQLELLDGPPAVDRVVLATIAAQGNVARVAALAAGVPATVPGTTINEQCSGGLAAIRLAVESVAAGSARLVLAGGTESVSQSTVLLEGRAARRSGCGARPRTSHAPPGWPDPEMGPAADEAATLLHISREVQDDYAARSYARAAIAGQHVFPALIAPVAGLDRDEMPRACPDVRRLARYPAAFGAGGTVTAGNAAALGDGAALVAVGHEPTVPGPSARVIGFASAAGDPAQPALAVVPAIEGALAEAGLEAGDIGRWEINEAFAVKVVACIRRFGLDAGRINVNGGAIAFGHPFSASGAILVVHLLAELARSEARYGVAAIAGAGGVGEAMVFETMAGR
jgi:acetyl-CoA C-acetyltransferase